MAAVFAPETDFFIEFTRRWWLDMGFVHPLFSPFMGFEQLFTHGLLDASEAFVAPCSLNEHGAGGVTGQWTPTVVLMGFILPD